MSIKTVLVLSLMLTALGCASGIKKAQIPDTANPSDEIARIENDINRAHAAHADVLASEDLAKAKDYLKEAKEDLADGDDQKDILESVAYSRAYLDQAIAKADSRHTQIDTVIEARQKAIEAGATNFEPTLVQMREMDELVRDNADRLDKREAKFVTDLQQGYMSVELNSIKNTQLGKANANIQAARKGNAGRYSPAALKRAEVDYKNAENLIAANRNEPSSYEAAVKRSLHSADLLTSILAATKGGRVDEGTASQVVMQERKIANLEGELDETSEEAATIGAALVNQSKNLKDKDAAILMQQSIENARKEFTPEEAEVFQQGDKLVIRLKSINFPSGRADVPSRALPVLAKVKGVAEELNVRQMLIEGHTDAVGTAQINKPLSEARATSIAKYFETNGISDDKLESVGYGFEKPIASNKSKVGRAQNRRVDIVLTPGQTAQSEERAPSADTETQGM